eukprot:1859964-Pyramimonas_sp.AAC.1
MYGGGACHAADGAPPHRPRGLSLAALPLRTSCHPLTCSYCPTQRPEAAAAWPRRTFPAFALYHLVICYLLSRSPSSAHLSAKQSASPPVCGIYSSKRRSDLRGNMPLDELRKTSGKPCPLVP